jgi:hypothetical protein
MVGSAVESTVWSRPDSASISASMEKIVGVAGRVTAAAG